MDAEEVRAASERLDQALEDAQKRGELFKSK